MPTTRTPARRRLKFTTKALRMFKRMANRECGQDEYSRLDDALHGELGLHPWQGLPTIVPGNNGSPHPPGAAGHQWDTIDGPKLFLALCDAADIKPEDWPEC